LKAKIEQAKTISWNIECGIS